MFWWPPRRAVRGIKRLDAEAEGVDLRTLCRRLPEARRKEYEGSDIIAKDWARVAVVVAKRTGLDVMHTAPRDADVALGNEPVAPSELRSNSEPSRSRTASNRLRFRPVPAVPGPIRWRGAWAASRCY